MELCSSAQFLQPPLGLGTWRGRKKDLVFLWSLKQGVGEHLMRRRDWGSGAFYTSGHLSSRCPCLLGSVSRGQAPIPAASRPLLCWGRHCTWSVEAASREPHGLPRPQRSTPLGRGCNQAWDQEVAQVARTCSGPGLGAGAPGWRSLEEEAGASPGWQPLSAGPRVWMGGQMLAQLSCLCHLFLRGLASQANVEADMRMPIHTRTALPGTLATGSPG